MDQNQKIDLHFLFWKTFRINRSAAVDTAAESHAAARIMATFHGPRKKKHNVSSENNEQLHKIKMRLVMHLSE
jgi:hypothetical protein